MSIPEKRIQELLDKQEITEVIYKLARSLDRMDGELMKSTYWEDAIDEHQDPLFPVFRYNDNAHAFVPIAMKGFETLKYTQHRFSNILIEIEGETAKAETYVYAYHVHEENGIDKEGILGGRCLFEFSKRNHEWKISYRLTLFDWNQNLNATAIWGEEYEDKYRGFRDKTDPSYQFIR